MLHPFQLNALAQSRHDDYLQKASRERLAHQVKAASRGERRQLDAQGLREVAAGVLYRTLGSAPALSLTEMLFKRHVATCELALVSGRTAYVVEGRLRLVVGGRESVVQKGDSYYIPGDESHCVEALKDARVVYVGSCREEPHGEMDRQAGVVAA